MKRTGFRRRNKFNAKPVHDMETGDTFDSTGEYNRYRELQLMEKAGFISKLELHPKVVLIAKDGDAPEIAYRPDYAYFCDGRDLKEDWKPRPATPRETLLFKLWRHFGPTVLLVTGGKTLRRIPGYRPAPRPPPTGTQ